METGHPIGVLTFHDCINYGTYWQARCLLKGLAPYQPVLLDHFSEQVREAEKSCAVQPTLPVRSSGEDVAAYGRKFEEFQRAIAALPKTRSFPLEEPAAIPRCETVVVGSDEVWNFRHPWYGGYPLFFGEGLQARRLVAYAATFGNYDATEGIGEEWSRRLRRFDAISVRDRNSQALVEAALGEVPPLVLDPCLQFPPDEPGGAWAGPAEPFLLVYGHSFSAEFGTKLRRTAEALKLTLVSVGYRNPWAHRQWLAASPDDFAQAFARCAAVATNFFHGCVFSLRFARPFVAELSAYRSNKVRDLAETVGVEHRLVDAGSNEESLGQLLSTPLEAVIGERLTRLRADSQAYLDHALA